jgi:hypothetical protein
MLMLPLPTSSKAVWIDDLVRSHTDDRSTIDDFKCKTRLNGVAKCTRIKSTGDALYVSINRLITNFAYVGGEHFYATKNKTRVLLSEYLDVPVFPDAGGPKINRYRLRAAVLHIGMTPSSGHYICLIVHNGFIVLLNDAQVTCYAFDSLNKFDGDVCFLAYDREELSAGIDSVAGAAAALASTSANNSTTTTTTTSSSSSTAAAASSLNAPVAVARVMTTTTTKTREARGSRSVSAAALPATGLGATAAGSSRGNAKRRLLPDDDIDDETPRSVSAATGSIHTAITAGAAGKTSNHSMATTTTTTGEAKAISNHPTTAATPIATTAAAAHCATTTTTITNTIEARRSTRCTTTAGTGATAAAGGKGKAKRACVEEDNVAIDDGQTRRSAMKAVSPASGAVVAALVRGSARAIPSNSSGAAENVTNIAAATAAASARVAPAVQAGKAALPTTRSGPATRSARKRKPCDDADD